PFTVFQCFYQDGGGSLWYCCTPVITSIGGFILTGLITEAINAYNNFLLRRRHILKVGGIRCRFTYDRFFGIAREPEYRPAGLEGQKGDGTKCEPQVSIDLHGVLFRNNDFGLISGRGVKDTDHHTLSRFSNLQINRAEKIVSRLYASTSELFLK